jgi:hypothetical protein
MSERIKRMASLVAGPPGMSIYHPRPGYPIHFHKGNRHAARENLSEDANQRRVEGILKALATCERIKRGEKVMTVAKKKARKHRKRAKLNEALIMEARQVQEIARKTAPEVMKMLREVVKNEARNERTSDRIAAASVILDRAYGKANQTNTNVNVDANGKAAEVSRKELTTRIEESLRRVEELAGRAPEKGPSQEGPVDIRKRDGDPGSSTLH